MLGDFSLFPVCVKLGPLLAIPDHFACQFAPIPALLSAADATSVLRVGSFVFDNDFRHPAMLAKDVATLDILSDERFELGMGAGWIAESTSKDEWFQMANF